MLVGKKVKCSQEKMGRYFAYSFFNVFRKNKKTANKAVLSES